MPQVTLNLTNAQAARIVAALSKTDYPPTVGGFKQMLSDYIRSLVREYENNVAREAALGALTTPPDLVVS